MMEHIRYAELHAVSNFSFLRGASHPEELVEEAARLGYTAFALTDECSLAGAVRAHAAAKKCGLQFIVGSEFAIGGEEEERLHIVVLPVNRQGYGNLCRLITRGRRAAVKGSYRLARANLTDCLEHCLVLWRPGAEPKREDGEWLKHLCPDRLWIAVELLCEGGDRARLQQVSALGAGLSLPLVACGDVHMHVRERRVLRDVVASIRLNTPLAQTGYALQASGERHLRPVERIGKLYPRELLDETLRIAERCRFSLDELRYEYPRELVPEGETAGSWLRKLTEEGVRWRWPEGASAKVRRLIERELELIAALEYEAYFLTVHDLVRFARSRDILCQGRGSAANSTVCYCLGVTSVNPELQEVLFERFISKERNEPPDIDVDFEHERREEVIQYLYEKYSRQRAALAATVISYCSRSAWRDVAKALGEDHPRCEEIVEALQRFPRHLSQHVGGFVISRGPLDELVPIENAAMQGRTVIQWDKNDLESLGLLKVDVLALGMLTALKKALVMHRDWNGEDLTLAQIPAEDPRVYDMIQRADSIGVFQIESRAQMSMLPRLRPRKFYDLVVQIAIVRPGPIQGDMVHPYLRRRAGEEPEDYPSPQVRGVLERTLGVPIFQEQVMQLAIVAAGFTGGEADELRRSMGAWQRRGTLERFQQKLLDGMRARNYSEEFAQRVFRQIQGFGEYGFPESHSSSFALLAYASAWIKCHHPGIFVCALLNSQPMGFYAPAQLIRDAREHGVEVRAADVGMSEWDCTLEGGRGNPPAVRLGLRMIKGLSAAGAERLTTARAGLPDAAFKGIHDLARRARLTRADLHALAAANALASLSGNRHRASWEVAGVEKPLPLLEEAQPAEGIPMLRAPTEGQNIRADYASVGLTLGRHPLALLRNKLAGQGVVSTAGLRELKDRTHVRVAGLVIGRQRPGTASGVTFVTLEDETGHANVIVWKTVADRQPAVFLGSQLMEVRGELQREGDVLHVIAGRLVDRSRWLGALAIRSRDFH